MNQNEEANDLRRRIAASRASLAGQLEQLGTEVEDQFGETADHVNAAAETITETVDAVHGGIEATRRRVSEAADFRGHVQHHPWAMMLGAAAVGYVGARCVQRRRASDDGYYDEAPVRYRRPSRAEHDATPAMVSANGNGKHEAKRNGSADGDEETLVQRIGSTVGPVLRDELQVVKGLALGAVAGMIRDMAANAAPDRMGGPIEESFDHLTRRMGGRPVPSRPRMKPVRTEEPVDDATGATDPAEPDEAAVHVNPVGDL